LRQSCRGNQNTHFKFNNISFRKTRHLRDIVEKHCTAGQATDHNIIRRMRFACWITEATDTHSEYLVLTALPQQSWFRQSSLMLRISCFVKTFLPSVRFSTIYYEWGIWRSTWLRKWL